MNIYLNLYAKFGASMTSDLEVIQEDGHYIAHRTASIISFNVYITPVIDSGYFLDAD